MTYINVGTINNVQRKDATSFAADTPTVLILLLNWNQNLHRVNSIREDVSQPTNCWVYKHICLIIEIPRISDATTILKLSKKLNLKRVYQIIGLIKCAGRHAGKIINVKKLIMLQVISILNINAIY